jgi:hypothetical protein
MNTKWHLLGSLMLAMVSVLTSADDVGAATYVVKVYQASTGTTLVASEHLQLTAKDCNGAIIPIGGVNFIATTTGEFATFTATAPSACTDDRTIKFEIQGLTSGTRITIGGLNGDSAVQQKIFATWP